MPAPPCVAGKFLLSPEGIALVGSLAAWLFRRDFMQSKRWKVIQERAEIVFDSMEGWAEYMRRTNGKVPSGAEKLEAFLEYVEKAVVAVGGGGKLTDAERAALAATAAVKSWLAKGSATAVTRGKK